MLPLPARGVAPRWEKCGAFSHARGEAGSGFSSISFFSSLPAIGCLEPAAPRLAPRDPAAAALGCRIAFLLSQRAEQGAGRGLHALLGGPTAQLGGMKA